MRAGAKLLRLMFANPLRGFRSWPHRQNLFAAAIAGVAVWLILSGGIADAVATRIVIIVVGQ